MSGILDLQEMSSFSLSPRLTVTICFTSQTRTPLGMKGCKLDEWTSTQKKKLRKSWDLVYKSNSRTPNCSQPSLEMVPQWHWVHSSMKCRHTKPGSIYFPVGFLPLIRECYVWYTQEVNNRALFSSMAAPQAYNKKDRICELLGRSLLKRQVGTPKKSIENENHKKPANPQKALQISQRELGGGGGWSPKGERKSRQIVKKTLWMTFPEPSLSRPLNSGFNQNQMELSRTSHPKGGVSGKAWGCMLGTWLIRLPCGSLLNSSKQISPHRSTRHTRTDTDTAKLSRC